VEVGPFVALGALVAGVLVGERAGIGAANVALVTGAAALGAAWFTRARVRVAIVGLALALLGVAVMGRAIDGRHSTLQPAIDGRASVTVSGEVTRDPTGSTYASSALVRVVLPRGGHRTLLVAASGSDAMVLRVLEAGDRVVLRGRLGPLRGGGFDDRARWEHSVGRLDQTELLALGSPRGLPAIADAARARVLRGMRDLAPTRRALTAGFLLGDTRDVPADVAAEYRDSGLSHLLAVSGENVAFVLALAGPLLRRLRLGARTAAALAVIIVFAVMTRCEPSVLRASMMAAIALLASFAGRPVSTARVLAYAIIVLLIVDPFLVHSVGFALSCAASAGIAFGQGPIARRIPAPGVVRDPLAVSLAAQLGVMPVLLAAFGSFPLITPVTNLLAAPAAETVGVYGLFASVVAFYVPALGPLLQQPTALLVGWISAVARAGAAVPMQLDTRGVLGVCALAAAGASVACLRARRAVSEPAPR